MISVQIGPVAQELVLENRDNGDVAAVIATLVENGVVRELVVDQPERFVPDPKASFGWYPIT